jgi:hypothetical protein
MKRLRHLPVPHALLSALVLAIGIALFALGEFGLALILALLACVGVLAWLFRVDARLEAAARRRGGYDRD